MSGPGARQTPQGDSAVTTSELPPVIATPVTGSLGEIPSRNARQEPGRPVYALRTPDGWVHVSAAEFDTQVQSVARGLIARGIRPTAPVAILAPTRYEWTVLDFALWRIGAFAVPVYHTSSLDQTAWILSDSAAMAVIAGDHKQAALAREALAANRSTAPVWVMDDDLLALLTDEGGSTSEDLLSEYSSTVVAESTATVVYTSGTTGRPKGCLLTHGNLLFIARTLVASTRPVVGQPGARTVLFLPLAHILGRGAEVYCAEGRMQVAHCSDIAELPTELRDFSPTFIVGVPRIFEKVYGAARQRALDSGREAVFERAADVAERYGRDAVSGKAGPLLRLQHALFDRLVYRRIRDSLGGELRYAITGGAGLAPRLHHFFAGVGVTVMEGYGLTETTASAAFNRAEQPRPGSVGQVMPGTAIRIADDGEIQIRGPQVMTGYLNRVDATTEVIDQEGWFSTGDLGRLDQDGYLFITGRKKEIIVTAGGKNVAPAVLEERLQGHYLIGQALVVGEGRPFIAAILTLDPDAAADWARRDGRPELSVEELASDPKFRGVIATIVEEANAAVSRPESIRAWRVVGTPFTEAAGQVTPTQKLKREVITRDFADVIDSIYA